MPGLESLPQNHEMINSILDTAWSPVARFRLLSGGISPNHLLEGADNIVGQKACLACGNCVDACPVVLREKEKINLQVQRTSLHLETIVEDSCLRCFRCIQYCPQVDSDLKICATRHRMTEKLVHWWMAIGYLILAASGVSLNHFRDMWSEHFITWISVGHKLGAVIWLLSPFLFYFFDRYHFRRMAKAVFSFGRHDLSWWVQAAHALFKKEKRPFQGEYNSGQKTWYLVVFGTMAILGATGVLRWFWEDNLAPDTMEVFILVHIAAAVMIDVSFAFHFGRKFLSRAYQWFRVVIGTPKPRENKPAYLQKEQVGSFQGAGLVKTNAQKLSV